MSSGIGKKAQIDIQESIPELQKILAKRKSLYEKKRIKRLIGIKSGKLAIFLMFLHSILSEINFIINLEEKQRYAGKTKTI